ncbi:MAG: hypothetical protein A3G41_06840 [Elusimicrobia bacterium RIFCSPLOWO2_12_FULL_59_9]|nr:MAG: hypothetical protein A3G41_06840 [Elusimicrobia bacterium RIFCSPLOWO2_12_FULL_59_9]
MAGGWNVFQYKKRGIKFASNQKKIVAGLKTQLKGALAQIEKAHGRKPNHYILFVSFNLAPAQKKSLKESILDGFDRPPGFPDPAILGAQELAQLLNDNPHIRAAYFQPLAFRTWKAALEALGSRKFLGKEAALQGREDLLKRSRALIEDPKVRVIAFWGPHEVGKSRLALEAARERMDSVVVAADPQELAAGDLRALVAAHRETLCIAEDPDPQRIEALIQEALAEPNLKLLLTIPIPSHAQKPAFGADNRVQHVEVTPLSWEESKKLIDHVAPEVPFEIANWICQKSGGIPGVILAAASVGEDLRADAADFGRRVGEEFARRVETQFGERGLQAASLASILSQVGVTGNVEVEAQLICELFGDGMTVPDFTKEAMRLCEAGVLRRRGSYVEAAIPMLANYLAGEAMNGKRNETLALFARLGTAGRIRLLRRLRELNEPATAWFWNEIFGKDGLFEGVRLLDHTITLETIAGAAPEWVLSALKTLLDNISVKDRAKIAGDQRRNLVSALEQLLFRRKTSGEALRLMGLLAEADDETSADNATGIFAEIYATDATRIFAECFDPHHSQMPLPLNERLAVLREFAKKPTLGSRRLALKAVKNGIPNGGGAFSLRQIEGATFFDPTPPMTWSDVWEYVLDLLNVAWDLAQYNDAVSVEAKSKLPDLVKRVGLSTPPRLALPSFQRLVDMALSSPPKLEAAAVCGAIEWALDHLNERLDKENISEDARQEVKEAKTTLEALLNQFDVAKFPVRLHRRLGKGYRFGHDEDEAKKIEALAEEAVAHPELLADDVWGWIQSDDALVARQFITALGRKDASGRFRERIEIEGTRSEGADIFSSYWYGWAERNTDSAEEAERRLDELAAGDRIDGKAVVLATWSLQATEAGVRRIIEQIRRGRAPGDFVAWIILRGKWMKPLIPEQAARLLRAISGEDFAHGARVMDLLGMWLQLKNPLEGELEELAWQTLEADPLVNYNDAWDCDQVAAHLAERNLERAFALLVRLAGADRSGRWDPIENRAQNKFCRTLWSHDRSKALGAVMRGNPRWRMQFERALKRFLSPVEDRDAILNFAKESVENARFLAGCLTAAAPGFWALAAELLALYPDDDQLWFEIAGDMEGVNETHWGTSSSFLEKRKAEVQKIIAHPATTAPLRRRLQDWLARAGERIGQHVVWEYDDEIDGLMRHVQDKDSAQRLWAIGRILKYASLKEVRKLLKIEDIEEALPNVDLPHERRQMFEAALPVWKNGR